MTIATPEQMIASSHSARMALPPPRLRPFAEDKAGFAYFRSDYHHRFLVAAILRHLAEGRCFLLASGETAADGELVRRFLDEDGKDRYRATLVRCRPGMDYAAIMSAYSRELGLRQESDGSGIWSLLSQLMHEARNGITRLLILDHAESLERGSIEELLRFTQLDQPRLMPVMLLARHGHTETGDTPPVVFPDSPLAVRIPIERLEPEEVGAFIRYQLNALGSEASTPFAPEAVLAIAAAAQGSPTTVNRLTRQAMEDTARGDVAPHLPAVIAAPAEAEVAAACAEADAEAEAVADAADAAPPARLPATRWRRLPAAIVIGLYIAAAPLCGLVMLYFLVLRAPPPKAFTGAPDLVASEAAPTLSQPQLAAAPEASNGAPAPPVAAPAPVAVAPEPAQAASAAAPSFEASDTVPVPAPVAAASAPSPAPPAVASPAQASDATPAPAPFAAAAEPSPSAAPVPSEATAAAPAPMPAAISEPAAPSAAQIAATAEPAPAAAPPPADASDAKPAPGPIAPGPAAPAPSDASAAKPAPAVVEAALPPPEAANPPAPSRTPPAASPQTAPPEPSPPTSRVTPDPAAAFMVRRGYELLAAADIVSARRFFERAALSGDGPAAVGLAKTYDPQYLRQLGTVGLKGDAVTALSWYRRAATAGSAEAQARLLQLGAPAAADTAPGR